jgi:hypothetical protein
MQMRGCAWPYALCCADTQPEDGRVKLSCLSNLSLSVNIFFIHIYEHTYAHLTPMINSERLSQLDLKIHKIGHQEHIAVDGDVTSH